MPKQGVEIKDFLFPLPQTLIIYSFTVIVNKIFENSRKTDLNYWMCSIMLQSPYFHSLL